MPSAIIEANKRTRVRKKGGDVMRATKVDEPDEQNKEKIRECFLLLIIEMFTLKKKLTARKRSATARMVLGIHRFGVKTDKSAIVSNVENLPPLLSMR